MVSESDSDEVYFVPVDLGNWRACADLELAPDQGDYVWTNALILAEAGLIPGARSLAVATRGRIVGLIVLTPHENGVEIHKFMVAHNEQKKGYGTRALQRMIELQRIERHFGKIYISFEFWNDVARKVYLRVGFADTGIRNGTEVVLSLEL